MKRLPLADQLEYRFIPPRPSRFWYRLGNHYSRYRIRREQKVAEFEIAGTRSARGSARRGRFGPAHAESRRPRRLLRPLRAQPAAGPALHVHGGLPDLHGPGAMGPAPGWRLLDRSRGVRPVGLQGGGEPPGRRTPSAGDLPRGRDLPGRRAGHAAARGGLRDRGQPRRGSSRTRAGESGSSRSASVTGSWKVTIPCRPSAPSWTGSRPASPGGCSRTGRSSSASSATATASSASRRSSSWAPRSRGASSNGRPT